jgi:hypothetical protein
MSNANTSFAFSSQTLYLLQTLFSRNPDMYGEQALGQTLDRHLDLLAHAQAKRYRTHPMDRSNPADSPLLQFLKATLPQGVR